MNIKIDPADKVFSQYIRLRDRECKRCHSKVKLNEKGDPVTHQASHFQGRRKENTRFDPENVDCLCTGCHMYFTANPAEHYEWQVKVKGQELVDSLVLKSNMYVKKDRKLMLIYWKQEYNSLKKSMLK